MNLYVLKLFNLAET